VKFGSLFLRACAAVAVGLTVLTGCAAGPAAQGDSDQKVVIQYNPTLYSWLGLIADKAGMFKANGVTSELKQIDNGTLATTALASGQITLAFQDLSLVSPYLNKGQKFTAVSGTGLLSWDVIAPKGTASGTFPESLKSLEGKRIGVPSLGSVAYYYARSYLREAGVDPDKVQFVAVGAFAQVPAVIATKQVDAAVVTPDQTYQLDQAGSIDVLFSAVNDREKVDPKLQKVIGTPGAFYFAQSAWVDANPELVRNVQKSLAQADVWAHDPANRSTLIGYLDELQLLPKTLTETSAKEAFVSYALKFMAGQASPEDMQAYVQFWKSNGVLTLDISGEALLAPSTPKTAADIAALAK
jgi:NitT/TauT family transport system substrate-binding protein